MVNNFLTWLVIFHNWFVLQRLSQQIVWRKLHECPIFIKKVWDFSSMVIGALGCVGTYDFWT